MYNLNTIIYSDDIQKTKPWFTVKRKIESSIGADSFVKIEDIRYISEYVMELNIITTYKIKAQGLVNILVTHYTFDEYTLNIRVFDNDGIEYLKEDLTSFTVDELKYSLESALLTNDLVICVNGGELEIEPFIIEIAKEVIQIYDNAACNIFKNANFIAEDIFKEVITNIFGNIHLQFTTTLNRNVPKANLYRFEKLWALKHSFINAMFKDDYGVEICPLMSIESQHYFNIKTNSREKAKAIATILKCNYSEDGKTLSINVLDECNKQVTPYALDIFQPLEHLTYLCKVAFYSNKFVKFIINFKEILPNNENSINGDIAIVLNNEVFQIYTENFNDYYGNSNVNTEDVFNGFVNLNYVTKLVNGEVKEFRIVPITETKRNTNS